MSNSQTGPSLPVGSVIAYAGNVTVLQQQEGWFLCDGRELNRLDHVELFNAIRYANGGDGSTTFKVPDYQGYFLRGVDQGEHRDPNADSRTAPPAAGNSGDAPGSLQQMATAQPASPSLPFSLRISHLPTESKKVNVDKLSGHRMMRWNGNTATIEFNGGGLQTCPVNNYVFFIIKHSQTTSSGAAVTIPVGAVVPIAGQNTAGLGNQWLLCNGSVLNRNMYKELFQVIQDIHGGDTETFYLPDYRGYFLRGVSGHLSHNDPDANNRLPPQPTLPPGQQGNYGDAVGSVQLPDTAQATNKFTAPIAHQPPLDPVEVDDVSGWSNARWTSVISHLNAPTSGGGNETRPINAYVDWYIKTS